MVSRRRKVDSELAEQAVGDVVASMDVHDAETLLACLSSINHGGEEIKEADPTKPQTGHESSPTS